MTVFRYLLLAVLLGGPLSRATAQAPAAAMAPSAAAIAPPRPGAAPDSGAVLVFNGWYLPRYDQATAGAADTTGALLALFRAQRKGGWLFTVPFIVGMSLALPISTTDSNGQKHVASEAISPPIGSAVLVAGLVGFIAHATRYNKSHLVAVDHAYAAGQPLPAHYRRRLSSGHFAEAAYLRNALAQQMERERVMGPASPK